MYGILKTINNKRLVLVKRLTDPPCARLGAAAALRPPAVIEKSLKSFLIASRIRSARINPAEH